MARPQEGTEYKWVDVADCSFGELHSMLLDFESDGWVLDSIVGPQELPETALYGNAGALQLWLKRDQPQRRAAA